MTKNTGNTADNADREGLDPRHAVLNQAPPFEDVNLFSSDVAMVEAVARECGGARETEPLSRFGAVCGGREAGRLAQSANVHTPQLATHDHQGRRSDEVAFHPAYHALMEISCVQGLKGALWDHLNPRALTPGGNLPKGAPGGHVYRAAGLYMATQMEPGHCCPITMTNAAVPTLMQQPDVARLWLEKIQARSYDKRALPISEKTSVTLGMGMTERQGGTDVRQNITLAKPADRKRSGPGARYIVNGHKWFMSAPMSDGFLVLAQTEGGLSCFLLPRFRDDGSANGLHFQRLKDKLGNRSNASSEVEFVDAEGWLIGEEGRGVATIVEMVTYTRLDCAVSSAGLMRSAVAQALHHCRHRQTFGKPLIDHVVMQQVLADLALETEAAMALSFRLARAFDHADTERAYAWRRLMTPVTKYWVCKIAPSVVAEAMECLGGNGYVEALPLARIYREVPVNSIWEGSGNVMTLDVMRVLQKEPEVVEVVLDELGQLAGDDAHLKSAHARIETCLHEPRTLEIRIRMLVEGLATLAAGAILRGHAPPSVADGFIATRLGSHMRQTYGQGLEWTDTQVIVDRALPELGPERG